MEVVGLLLLLRGGRCRTAGGFRGCARKGVLCVSVCVCLFCLCKVCVCVCERVPAQRLELASATMKCNARAHAARLKSPAVLTSRLYGIPATTAFATQGVDKSMKCNVRVLAARLKSPAALTSRPYGVPVTTACTAQGAAWKSRHWVCGNDV